MVTMPRSSLLACLFLFISTFGDHGLVEAESAQAVIDAYPNTTMVKQGTTLVLVCRVVGVPASTMLNYDWTCPGAGDSCNAGEVDPMWAAKVQQDNILVVNVRNGSDNGEYNCTVHKDMEQLQMLTARYTLRVAEGQSFLNENGGLRVFFPNNSFVTNTTLTKTTNNPRPTGGNDHIACYGGDPLAAQVTCHNSRGPLAVCNDHGNPIACVGCGPSCQRNGAVGVDAPLNGRTNIHFFLSLSAYKNQDLQCRVNESGGQSAFIGVYLKDGASALSPPSNLMTSGATTTTTVSVAWSPVSGATGYYVSYQRKDLGIPPMVTPQYERIVGGTTNVTLSGLEPGTTYRIRVWSTDGTSVSSEAGEMNVTMVESAPSPPRMLTLIEEQTESSTVELNWLPPLHPNGAIRYEIEYEPAMTPGDPVNAGNSSSPYFTLTLPNEFLTYTVRVAAVNSKGRTKGSDPLLSCLGKNRERGPQPPTGVSVDTLSHESVDVSWNAQQSMQCDVVIGNYSVRYQRRNAITAGYTAVYSNETNVTLQELEPETNYRVSVISIASNGNISAYSDWVQFTTAMATPSQAYPSSSFHVGVVVGAAIGGFVGGVLLTAAIGSCLACAVFCRSRAKGEVTAKKEIAEGLYENPPLQANPAYWTTSVTNEEDKQEPTYFETSMK